jgi:hypothetical protein
MNDESDTESGRDGETGGGAHPVHEVIQAFGGIRPMANKLGIAVSTVQGWKNRDAIPEPRHQLILDTAREHGIELSLDLLRATGDGSTEEETVDGDTDDRPGAGAAVEAEVVESRETDTAATATGDGDADEAPKPSDETVEGSPWGASASDDGDNDRDRRGTDGGGTGGDGGGGAGSDGDRDESIPPQPHVIERPRPTGWVPGLLLGAAVLVLGAGGAIVLREHWLPMVGGAAGSDRITERVQQLDGRLDSLQGRLNGLSGRVDAAAEAQSVDAVASTVESVQSSMDELAQQVADLEERLAAGAASGDDGDGVASAALAQINETQDEIAARLDSLANRQDSLANQQQQVSGRLDDVTGRFDSVTERLDTLAGRLGSLSDRADKLADSRVTQDALAKLSERVNGLDQKFTKLADIADIQTTRKQAAAAAEKAAARELGRAMAVVQLQDALRDSEPYAGTLSAAKNRLPGDGAVADALSTLSKHADSGVPTRERLLGLFRQRAGEAVAVSASDQDDGLLTGVLRRLGDVIRIRPVGGGQSGSGAGAALARAEAKLDARDLQGAIADVESLSGPPADSMAPWLAKARARVSVDNALDTLRSEIIAPDSAANGNDDGA